MTTKKKKRGIRATLLPGLGISGPDRLPHRLKPDATQPEIIKAINELAIETQLCRLSIQDVGTKLGELSEHIRDALLGGRGPTPI